MSISTNLDGVTQIGTWNFNLSQVGGANFVLGPNNKASSLSVTIATDQGAIPVSISGTVPVSISATVPVTFDPTQPLTLNPVQVVNPNDSDNKVPLVVSLTASDVQNIINPVTVTGAVTASGTVTAAQGAANATPWNENIAQVGGNPVVTGTGASGVGIPRVTVSSDSVISGITNPVTVTGSLAFAGTGPQPSAQSTSVVVAPDQVVPTTVRDPVQVINPKDGDQLILLSVQLAASDIQNIINPITVANFPAIQPVSIPGTVSVAGTVPVSIAGTLPSNISQVNGAAPSAANPLPVQISDGAGFKDPSTLLATLVQLTAIQLAQQATAGFFAPEVPPFLGA